MLTFSLAGMVVGIAVGATGVGGGSLMTPILILGMGVAPTVAVGTDLLYASLTKAFGVWLHRTKGTVNWKVVSLLAAGSLPASLMTILVLRSYDNGGVQKIMTLTLASAIVLTSLFTLFNAQLRRASTHDEVSVIRWFHGRWRAPLTVILGVIVGLLVTLSSVGAGVIVAAILLVLYPRMPAISIVGTDLAHAIPLTLLAGLGHASMGNINVLMLGWLLTGSLPGIYLGTKLGFYLPDRQLRPLIGGILLLIGILLILR